jgi:hypothetical protein
MIDFSSNLQNVIARIGTVLQSIDTDAMTKEMATTAVGMMHDRIHGQGKASDGSGIGTYSAGYMKVRTGDFGNSARVSRGNNKGNPKDAGTYARGAKKGKLRPNYHRAGSTDVILSLTREMENDFAGYPQGSGGTPKPFRSDNGNWSIGFIRNPNRSGKAFTHMDIARNAERMLYGKPVYSLSADEQTAVDSVLEKYVVNAFNSRP